MTFRLQMSELAKPLALAELDRLYADRIAAVMGPFAALHALKREQALAGGGPLVADEADRLAIIAAVDAEMARLADLETRRLAFRARIRAAQSNAEISVVLAEAKQP